MKDKIEDIEEELKGVQSNIQLLNSVFSGLNTNYSFIQDHLRKIESKLEGRKKENKVTSEMFINQIVMINEKIDLMLNENGKTSGQDSTTQPGY